MSLDCHEDEPEEPVQQLVDHLADVLALDHIFNFGQLVDKIGQEAEELKLSHQLLFGVLNNDHLVFLNQVGVAHEAMGQSVEAPLEPLHKPGGLQPLS